MNILILTCNTGGGHIAVAAALTEAFRQRGADSRVLDGLSFVSRKASKFVSRWHTRFYRHYPQLYKAGYMSAEEKDGRPYAMGFDAAMNYGYLMAEAVIADI